MYCCCLRGVILQSNSIMAGSREAKGGRRSKRAVAETEDNAKNWECEEVVLNNYENLTDIILSSVYTNYALIIAPYTHPSMLS